MTNKVIFNMGQGEPAVTGRIPEEWLREAKCWAGHDVEVVVSDAGVLEQFRINLAKGAGVEEGGRLVKLAMRITGAIEPIQRAMDVFSQENSRFTLLRGGLGGSPIGKRVWST